MIPVPSECDLRDRISHQFIPLHVHRHRSYPLHHFTVELTSNIERLVQHFDELFRYFSPVNALSNGRLKFYIDEIAPRDAPPFTLSDAWEFGASTPEVGCYFSDHAILYRYHETGVLTVNLQEGVGYGHVLSSDSSQETCAAYRDLVLLALMNMLQFRGMCPLHASAVADDDGRGIVVVGASGQGKTTLLLRLLNAGYHYLADDAVFVSEREDASVLFAFPTPIRVTPQTPQFFPTLQPLIDCAALDDKGKFSLTHTDISTLPPLRSAHPILLLFPSIVDDSASSLCPMSRIEAAMQCISGNMPIGPIHIRRKHFDILSRFAQSVRCYRVKLGHDMSTIGQQIGEILSSRDSGLFLS